MAERKDCPIERAYGGKRRGCRIEPFFEAIPPAIQWCCEIRHDGPHPLCDGKQISMFVFDEDFGHLSRTFQEMPCAHVFSIARHLRSANGEGRKECDADKAVRNFAHSKRPSIKLRSAGTPRRTLF
jgi:hypothetical protein